MRKALSLILAFILCLSLCACDDGSEKVTVYQDGEKIETISVDKLYDLVKNDFSAFRNKYIVEGITVKFTDGIDVYGSSSDNEAKLHSGFTLRLVGSTIEEMGLHQCDSFGITGYFEETSTFNRVVIVATSVNIT